MAQTVSAYLRYLHLPPRKTRFVADTIRGLGVDEAEARLLLASRRPNEPLLKLLRSAIANATNNFKLEPGKLFVKEIRVDQGPKQKRWVPRARGSIYTIEKKTSHVTIVLGVRDEAKPARYTILPKPKKDKEARAKERKRRQGRGATESKEKHPPTPSSEKSIGAERPKSKGGFMKRVFRRKSI